MQRNTIALHTTGRQIPLKRRSQTHYKDTRDITLIYEWNDDNDSAGIRPERIGIQLYDEDGNEIQGLQMVQADANGIWSCSWTGLDTDKTYTAKVRSIDGSSIEGDITEDTGLNADYDFGVMTIGANDSVIIMDSTLGRYSGSKG